MLVRRVRAGAFALMLVLTGALVSPAPAAADEYSPWIYPEDGSLNWRWVGSVVNSNHIVKPPGMPGPNPPRRASAQDTCLYVAIRARSGRWLAAEFGGGGMLEGRVRARSERIAGPWEMMWVCRNAATGMYYLSAQRDFGDQFIAVAAEMGSQMNEYGVLRARTSTDMPIGTWELFRIQDSGEDWKTLQQWDGPYVASEEDWTGSDAFTLRARTTGSLGYWEQFAFYMIVAR
jgi:hypothetical protein